MDDEEIIPWVTRLVCVLASAISYAGEKSSTGNVLGRAHKLEDYVTEGQIKDGEKKEKKK